jgi:hypothetical protein
MSDMKYPTSPERNEDGTRPVIGSKYAPRHRTFRDSNTGAFWSTEPGSDMDHIQRGLLGVPFKLDKWVVGYAILCVIAITLIIRPWR